jgi:hypothetical protein
MPSWREEYAQALDERDEREKASYERISEDFIDACEQSRILFTSTPNKI